MNTKTVKYLLPLILYCTTILNAYKCQFETENATFDLCALRLTSNSRDSFYEVFDDTDEYNKNFTYIFNIGDNIQKSSSTYQSSLPQNCFNQTLRKLNGNVLGPCNESYINLTHDGYVCENDMIASIDQLTSVYQLHRDSDVHSDCYRLHDGLTKPEFQLNDRTDPTLGFRLIYRNGDWCEHSGRNREFEINFICADFSEIVPDLEQVIVEGAEDADDKNGCWYTLEYNSTYGCPLECPVVEKMRYVAGEVSHRLHLCAGNGRCSYDESNHRPMCFCYTGYYGDDCTMTVDPNTRGEYKENDIGWIIGLSLVLCVLFGAILIIIYLLRRIYYEKIVGHHVMNMRGDIDADEVMGVTVDDDENIVCEVPTKRGRSNKVNKDTKQAVLLDADGGEDVVIIS